MFESRDLSRSQMTILLKEPNGVKLEVKMISGHAATVQALNP